MSIKLYCFQKETSDPSVSGYCQKLETFLRATGFTDYTLHFTAPHNAPKGKLPYIEITQDGKTDTVADSSFVIRYLIENKVVSDPDKNLTAAQRADSMAWQAWTEELVYPALVYQRWVVPANFYVSRASLPGSWPYRMFLGWYLRRHISNALWAQGVGRHSDEERERLMREYVEGLEARLEKTEFFHGSEPTLVDIVIYGFLVCAAGYPANPEYLAMVLGSERLKKYTVGLTRRWFPEYEKVLEVVGKACSD